MRADMYESMVDLIKLFETQFKETKFVNGVVSSFLKTGTVLPKQNKMSAFRAQSSNTPGHVRISPHHTKKAKNLGNLLLFYFAYSVGSVLVHATHTFELDFGHGKRTFYSALALPVTSTNESFEYKEETNCGTIGTVSSGTMQAYKRKLTAADENDRILDAFEAFLNPLNSMNDLIDDDDEEDDYDYDN